MSACTHSLRRCRNTLILLWSLLFTTLFVSSQAEHVGLCDCQPATGLHGLECGYGRVMARFDHVSDQVDFVVPLSNAQCCTPCLPKNRTKFRANDPVVAVAHLGCTQANDYNGFMCNPGQFLVGFQNAVPLKNSFYFPEGRAQCCSLGYIFESQAQPLLLQTCADCQLDGLSLKYGNPGCLGMPNGGGAYVGFRSARLEKSTSGLVPVAPAECCGLCTADALPSDPCKALGDCGDHGSCDNGVCQCLGGYTGTRCDVPPPSSGDSDSKSEQFANFLKQATLFLLSAVAGCMCFICMCFPRHAIAERRRRGGDEEEPLIGSDDASDDEDDEDDETDSSVTMSPSEGESDEDDDEEDDDDEDGDEDHQEEAVDVEAGAGGDATCAAASEEEMKQKGSPATQAATGSLSAHRSRRAHAGSASGVRASVPKEFKCPITMRTMRDPVVCADGYTYERSAIQRWLRVKRCSPCTNEPVTSRRLVPNHSLRGMILAFNDSYGRCGKAAASIRKNMENELTDGGKAVALDVEADTPASEAHGPSASLEARDRDEPSGAVDEAATDEADANPGSSSEGDVELARNSSRQNSSPEQ